MAHLALDLLGPFRATLDNESISGLRSPRLQALLAYLAVEADREHARRALAEMIWPNRPEGDALQALRYALSNLRTAIGDRESDPPFLLITRSTLRLNPDSDYVLDVERFQQQISAAEVTPSDHFAVDVLRSAVELYRGDFLEGLFLPDAAALEEWALIQREVLARQVAMQRERCAQLVTLPYEVYASGLKKLDLAMEQDGEDYLIGSEFCLVEVSAALDKGSEESSQ